MYNRDEFKIICVTQRHLCADSFFSQLENICSAGVDGIILREKDLDEKGYLELAEKAADICGKYDVPMAAHSFPAAVRTGITYRLHMPEHRLSEIGDEERQSLKRLGTSIHSAEAARRAAHAGADYVTAGNIFETDCKKGLPGRGGEFLKAVVSSVDIPVYAIGGISPENIGSVKEQGAAGACLMSAFMQSDDPSRLLDELRDRLS